MVMAVKMKWFALLALLGCGWESDGLKRLEALYPSDAVEGATADVLPEQPLSDPAGDAAPAKPLSGTYAVRMHQYGVVMSYPLDLSDLFVGKVSEDGKAIALTFCMQYGHVNSPVEHLGEQDPKPALIEALASRPVQVPLDGGAPKDAVVAWLWGVRLDDPVNDPLPETVTDHVEDWDKDGHPAVTVTVLNPKGDRYMARRAVWTLHSGYTGGDWTYGGLEFRIDQKAYGGNPPLLATEAPISVDPARRSVWQMRKESDGFDCKQLLAGWPDLFKDAPEL